jgi:DNA-binding response OmpR family regulator
MDTASSVLIVEDDAAARAGLAQLITNAGFTVTTAADGREALEQVDRAQPGVVLLDIWMPHVNGLEVLSALKTRRHRPRVIVMTADDTPETVLLSLRQDAYQFISKPIELQPLLHLLRGVPDAAAAEASPSIVVLSARAGWLELLLPCTQEIADRIESYIANLEADLPDEVAASVGMVFKELLLDAMGGAGLFDPQRRVRIACLRAKRMLMFRIADAGYGFRAGDVGCSTGSSGLQPRHDQAAPTDVAIVPTLRPGLLLARELADELLVNERRDEVVFVKYLD